MLFDAGGKIRRYETPEQIVQEFFDLRLSFYAKRKAALLKVSISCSSFGFGSVSEQPAQTADVFCN